MSIARRVELRVVAIGGALPEDLTNRLLSATYTDNEEDAADDFQGASDLISYSQGRKNVVKCREETAGWRKHETADIE